MRRAALGIAVVALLAAVQLWGDSVRLQAGSIVPAAQGKVDLGHDRNNNTVVDLKVEHLALPTSLTPAKNFYVVWFQPREGSPENEGTLTVNPDTMAGSFKTTTPHKNFDILVTAEDNPRPESPSGVEVLKGTIAAK